MFFVESLFPPPCLPPCSTRSCRKRSSRYLLQDNAPDQLLFVILRPRHLTEMTAWPTTLTSTIPRKVLLQAFFLCRPKPSFSAGPSLLSLQAQAFVLCRPKPSFPAGPSLLSLQAQAFFLCRPKPYFSAGPSLLPLQAEAFSAGPSLFSHLEANSN